MIGVCFPAGAGNFSLRNRAQNVSGAHPASYPSGTGGSFPGSKAAEAWSWLLTSIYCRGQRMRGAIRLLPQYVFMAWCLVKHRECFSYRRYITSFIRVVYNNNNNNNNNSSSSSSSSSSNNNNAVKDTCSLAIKFLNTVFRCNIQVVLGALSLGVKRPRREADHSPPSSAKVKECVELYLHPPVRLRGMVLS
jgi:hypothetical protein